jgi:hypothetical protein
LAAFDLDNDPRHPNYKPGLAASYPTVLKAARLPATGTLYQACTSDGAYATDDNAAREVRASGPNGSPTSGWPLPNQL